MATDDSNRPAAGTDQGSGTAEPGDDQKTQQQLDDEARRRQDPDKDPRILALDAIAQANDARIEEQLAAEGLSSRTQIGEIDTDLGTGATAREDAGGEPLEGDPATPPATGAPAPAPARPRARAPAPVIDPQLLAQLGQEPLPVEALDNLRLRIKIDGQDRVLTLHELRRTAQIDGAAQTRLEQANALLRDIETARARLNGGAAPAPAPAAGAPPPVGVEGKPGQGDSSATSQDVNAIAKDLVQSLFVGDEEAATATVVKLLARQNVQFDTAALATRLAPAVRQQLSQEEAEAQFRSDFKDIVTDPNLVAAADRFYEQLVQEDPQKPYAELLAAAGTKTREWIQTVTGAKPATGQGTRSTREEKLQAKQRIDNVRSLSRTEGAQEEQVQSASQVIAEMRQQRGLG